ncbi:hypothetical protein O181_009938 [Austropuccinia psidii MF-1]|uniref:Retrotransposon gag domain-containing protein n=1 Tax=Austropuccinia psidii MF-1 TaxID=1389203 RepID=A0A9Q3BS04_9BASI|nr:hypothetical protein [Austropuccinia psidii MF-1]
MSEGARARLGEVENEEGEESVEEEYYGETQVADSLANAPETEPSLLKMMDQMTQFMGQLTQEVAPKDNSKSPAFKTSSIKEANSFDENPFSDRKKVLYSAFFLTGRAAKWIEPYLSNISNEDPLYLRNNWQLFEAQLFTLFGYPNELRKAEQELDTLRMKESGHVSFYIADFGSLISTIGDWGKRAYIHVYRRGLESRLLDQLASYPGNFDTLQELMDITFELDTRYHERKKEKGGNQEKKPPVIGFNFSKPLQGSP